GKPAGEGEDVRPFRDLEDLPDGRCLHARHARRQSKLHAATSFLRLRRDSVSGCCCNGTRVSSFTAERTTVVCVRVTPAMRRRESLMSRSSDSVSRVTTLSRYESRPATRWHSSTSGSSAMRRAKGSWWRGWEMRTPTKA